MLPIVRNSFHLISLRSNQLPPHKDRALDQRKYDYDSSSVMTSDVESSTVLDSDDDSDLTSRMSTTTDESSVSRLYHSRQQQLRRRRRKKLTLMSGAASSTMSSITDSSVSLNIITVTLNLGEFEKETKKKGPITNLYLFRLQ